MILATVQLMDIDSDVGKGLQPPRLLHGHRPRILHRFGRLAWQHGVLRSETGYSRLDGQPVLLMALESVLGDGAGDGHRLGRGHGLQPPRLLHGRRRPRILHFTHPPVATEQVTDIDSAVDTGCVIFAFFMVAAVLPYTISPTHPVLETCPNVPPETSFQRVLKTKAFFFVKYNSCDSG